MSRKANTTRHGGRFSDKTILAVWRKAKIVDGTDAAKKRKDHCDAWIEFNKYGDTEKGGTGWEIDHIKPVARDGDDDLNNLQPLQWQNNRSKGDDYPAENYCAVSAKL